MENAMRKHEKDATIPYWDSTLDSEMPNPAHSVIWDDDFLGDNNGEVTSGTFANWPAIDECYHKLFRHAGRPGVPSSNLMSKSDVEHALSFNTFQDLNADTSPQNIENTHGSVHYWVADKRQKGQMGDLLCSPSDPVFYMHHAFIDCIWELFRQTSQTTPLDEYTNHDEDSIHWPDAPMKPFGLMNKNGLANHYTKLV